MKTFGTDEITWRDTKGKEHAIVATKGSAWSFLCHLDQREAETVELVPQPTTEPVVWKHDRAKVTCEDCVAMLDRLDPGFRPSDVVLGTPPLVDTMGRAEAELAAALIVRACQVRGDAWQAVSPDAIVKVIQEDVAAGREPVTSMNRNPFWRPDAHDLVKRGGAEWVGAEGVVLRLTPKGLASLKKWATP